MRFALLASLTALLSLAVADVDVTAPSTNSAKTPIVITFKESGTGPAITTFTAWQALLVAGGQDGDSQVRDAEGTWRG